MAESWLWLIGLAGAIAFFVAVEGLAFKHPERVNTLSFCLAWLGEKFPLSIWICGVLAGGLATHFWWHFCPFGGGVG
jgi:hypothetical protein